MKKWLVIGDSISAEGLGVDKKYHDFIKHNINAEVINVAAAGTGYIHEFHGIKGWLDRLDEFPKKEDVDFITIMGALNDRHYPVGRYESENPKELYGALRLFYDELLFKYPTTPIGVITSTPRIYSWGNEGEFTPHVDAVINIAKHYSLPVLDLYRCSGLRPWIEENNTRFFDKSDGVHPNLEGQEMMSKKIYYFIKQNIL